MKDLLIKFKDGVTTACGSISAATFLFLGYVTVYQLEISNQVKIVLAGVLAISTGVRGYLSGKAAPSDLVNEPIDKAKE